MTTEQTSGALNGIVNTTSLRQLNPEEKAQIRQLLHLIEFVMFQ